MADVKTESLKTIDNFTKPTTGTSIEKMTVEKQSTHPPASKNRTTVKDTSSEALTVSPTQLKVASGNNVSASPQKSDVKNSSSSKVPSSGQPRPQQQVKSKVNPWHKNPSPTTSGSAKRGSNVAPEGSDKGVRDSPKKEDSSSKNIRIPKDEVCYSMLCVMICYVICKSINLRMSHEPNSMGLTATTVSSCSFFGSVCV